MSNTTTNGALVFFITIVALGCDREGANDQGCLEVGTIEQESVDGQLYLEGLIAEFGRQYSKLFLEDYLVRRRAQENGLVMNVAQLDARMTILEREMLASQGGPAGANAHLKRYGLDLDEWRRLTRARQERELLTLAVMREAPTKSLLRKTFERKFGVNGKRRHVRYLLISKKSSSQSLILSSEIEAARPQLLERSRKALEKIRHLTGEISKSTLPEHFGHLPYRYEKSLAKSALTLAEQRIVQSVTINEWSSISATGHMLAIYRTRAKEAGDTTFERLSLNFSEQDVIQSVFQNELSERARKRAEDLFGKLNAGDEFARLARTYSDHSVSRVSGGLFRSFERDNANLPKSVTAKILGLKSPGTLVMTEDAHGFHIIKLEKFSMVEFSHVEKELRNEIKHHVYDTDELSKFRSELVDGSNAKLVPRLNARCQATKRKR